MPCSESNSSMINASRSVCDESRAVLITGVSSGIGQAMAIHLMGQGFQVFGSVRRPGDAEQLETMPGESFTPLLFDICDRDALLRAREQMIDKLCDRPLHAIVNNAGVAAFGPLECLDDDHFEQSLRINVIGTRNVINVFLPLLEGYPRAPGREGSSVVDKAWRNTRTRKGKIINMSSLSGILNTPINGAYCVAKHGLESLGEVYRRELLGLGIDVVSIRSGPVQSQIWNKHAQPDVNVCPHSLYDRMSANAQKLMQSAERDALPGSVVGQLVVDILDGRKKRAHYEIGKGAGWAKLLSRLPCRWSDRLIQRALNKKL